MKVVWQSKEVFEIVIEHVKPEDAGVYKCTAINSEGEDETSGKISVSSKSVTNFAYHLFISQ